LVPRDKDPNSVHRHWWEPANISSEEEYNAMLGFMGKKNLDLLSEDWRPEDYEEPVHEITSAEGLNLQKLCGDLLGDGEYDQFVVEEVSDADDDDDIDNLESDKIIIEKNVKAPKKNASDDLVFIEPGYENHVSIFSDDKLTAREMDYVLNKISTEGVQKHKKESEELKEVLAALENPEEFEDANEDWLLGFDEEEDDGFWGAAPIMQTQTMQIPQPPMPVIIPEKPQRAPVESKPAEPEIDTKKEDIAENQAVNYEIEDEMDAEAFEKMLADFDDDKIGELDDDDVDGEVGIPASTYSHLYDDFIEKRKKDWSVKPGIAIKDHVTKYVANYKEETEEETKIEIDRLTWRPERNRWDCESVISTYSNLENHPRSLKMKKIQTSNKIQLRKGRPVYEKEEVNLGIIFEDEQKEEESDEEENITMVQLPNKREKNETKEEKKRRKRLVKQQRRIARQQKKALKKMFKEEKKKQEKINVALKTSHNTSTSI